MIEQQNAIPQSSGPPPHISGCWIRLQYSSGVIRTDYRNWMRKQFLSSIVKQDTWLAASTSSCRLKMSWSCMYTGVSSIGASRRAASCNSSKKSDVQTNTSKQLRPCLSQCAGIPCQVPTKRLMPMILQKPHRSCDCMKTTASIPRNLKHIRLFTPH